MKKMIYAVKNGRITGIFNEWLKCSEQTNGYSNAKFRRFEYRSELEEEAEDVPGSLRFAIKEAEEYLGDLVYLGDSADYLQNVSWEEDGFLPFGDKSEAENPEFFSDQIEEEEEEEIGDTDEGFHKWMADNKVVLNVTEEYWKIAEVMKKDIDIIKSRQDNSIRRRAAFDLKRQLDRCRLDPNLSELTAIYSNLEEENAIGYNPPAAARFVTKMLNTYPKPEASESVAEEEDSIWQIFMQAGAIETELKGHIYGQDAAIERLSEAYFNTELKMRLTPDKRGSRNAYLLAGPPGVGKTFMAQQFAYKLGLPFMRFNMSEYSHHEVIGELIGYGSDWKAPETGRLTDFVVQNPKCVLLFDEIEKAHITVIRLFLQILDDGVCEDKYYKNSVSFKDAIIFSQPMREGIYTAVHRMKT